MLIDRREQRPLVFPSDPTLTEVREETLPVGDYQPACEDGTRPPVVFERKSLADLAGTLTKNYDRFKAELLRAQEAHLTLMVIVEDSLTEVRKGAPYSQESGESLLQRCFTLMVKYRLPIIFCQDRREAARYILEFSKAVGRAYAERSKESHAQATTAEYGLATGEQ